MLKGKKLEQKRHLNQLRPKHTRDVIQEIDEEMPMEVLYDVYDIPVPLIPPMPEVTGPLTPSIKEEPAPRNPLIQQLPPAQKLV